MSRIFCFGEILWDRLPHGDFIGGAPFNVAYHLHQLGAEALMISAIGRDDFGCETLKRIAGRNLSREFVAEIDALPTGTVDVKLDSRGNASYVFADPAAWDRIPVTAALLTKASGSAAIVFGSLALRHEENCASLERLLAISGPVKVFDVNLRAPYGDLALVAKLAQKADVLKLNDSELAKLTGADVALLGDADRVTDSLRKMSATTGCSSICVTRGERGAMWLHCGKIFSAPAPKVTVRDTIGAGDAFTAMLTTGVVDGEASRDPEKLLRRCCALGAFVASQDGAQPDYDARKVLASVV